jgi:spore germination cell wall hydrolase CwlJ-like protein
MNIGIGLFWIILTVYHEARGEPPIGQKNVVKVILNRSHLKGWPVEDIIKARKQFSCFNDGITSEKVWIKDINSALDVTKNVVEAILEWENGDRLDGATHYYAPKGMPGGKPPYWVKGMKYIGQTVNHKFYREM